MSVQDKSEQTVPFGFSSVKASEKAGRVKDVFDHVASRYDLMNDLMSGGLHRFWKKEAVHRLMPQAGMHLLDLAGGTGDIAALFLKAVSGNAHVTVCDINAAMLSTGRDRLLDKGLTDNLSFVCGNAESLPFADRSIDACSIAFGLRNVTHRDKALSEIKRVLKPGGQFICLEFSHVAHPSLAKMYDLYSFTVLPALGEAVTGKADPYRYLAESIRTFPKQDDLLAELTEAGFTDAGYKNMTGGIVALHWGFAPRR